MAKKRFCLYAPLLIASLLLGSPASAAESSAVKLADAEFALASGAVIAAASGLPVACNAGSTAQPGPK